MFRRLVLGLVAALWGGSAFGVDFETLRHLNAAAPTVVTPLPAGQASKPVEFARMVLHPTDLDWALIYTSVPIRAEGDDTPANTRGTWSGRLEGETVAFARAFEDELRTAGFSSGAAAGSLFDTSQGGTDLKVGVTIDDIRGRFCIDCPNMFNPKGIPATVVMTAHWEIYSSLERRVIAKITTSGGADYKKRLDTTVAPVIMAAFREQVRQLLASPEFRNVVVETAANPTISASSEAPLPTLTLAGSARQVAVAQAMEAVAVVYAADGAGSGFLVSADGYVLTNQHVVGGSKYVKLKWPDGSEALGEVVRSNTRRDVALIKTDAKGRSPLTLRRDQPGLGETVFAIGTPLDDKFQNSLTKGIVSATRTYDGLPFIQSDVAINHGNSGGPLLDERGNVVALTVSGMMVNDAQVGINFFIPIDDALRALNVTAVAGPPTPPAPHPNPSRAASH